MKTVLITGASHFTPRQIEKICDLGCSVIFMQNETEDLPVTPGKVEIVVCNGLFLYHDITLFSSLKIIQLTSAGLDRVPLDYIRENNIQLFNARGVYSIPMAEWVIGRILEYYKHFKSFNLAQHQKEWNKARDVKEINGTKAAIIGAGSIGQEVAKRLSVFGSTVTGYDVFLGDRPFFEEIHHVCTLAAEIQCYDVVVLTAPLTDETRHMISKPILEAMKQDAMLVNIARGGLIDTKALIKVLSERTDLFAALDVFEEEPLKPDSPIWALPNVAISPHNSFVSDGNNERMFSVTYSNLKTYLEQ